MISLPIVTAVTPFDQLNIALSTLTFAAELSDEMQTWLSNRTKQFNDSIPGSPSTRPLFHTNIFDDRMRLTIYQCTSRQLPTKELFNQFIDAHGISLPEATVAAIDTFVHPNPKPVSVPPLQRNKLFVKRHQGF